MLTWLHFGDLHAEAADGWQSLRELDAMIADANRFLFGAVDFAYLPGDNANHGTPDQYQRIRHALERLRLPWHVIPGDHDVEPGDLGNFERGLGARALPYSVMAKGHRCLFLDIVSPGRGGPDFRLGPTQTGWLRDQLAASRLDAGRPLVFMHAFPGDLAEGAEAIGQLFAEHAVACVDTGHTHYNELLNDGAVILAATRSTGQIEEGPVGFSLHAVDGTAVSWRFKESARPYPFVLITSPADQRLVTDPGQPDQVPGERVTVRAKVFGHGVASVSLAVDGRDPLAMQAAPDEPGLWSGVVDGLAEGPHRLRVTARDAQGQADTDVITVRVARPGLSSRPPAKARPGDSLHSIGAWAEHGLLGSQLGPNKNGKSW